MRVNLFDFDLPDERIALRPVAPRDAARLLVVGSDGASADRCVRDLPGLLKPNDVLVLNDTRVVRARLRGRRRRADGAEAAIELLLHRREAPDRWDALAKPAKRLAAGDRIDFGGAFAATVERRGEGGEVALRFDRAGAALEAAIESVGELPLPPYIAGRRPVDEADLADYQTLHAREAGAVAAPTAGLHFTPRLLAELEAAGIGHVRLTLHVGAGTFLPVKAEDVADHRMHAERGTLSAASAEVLNRARAGGGRIVAVGTTSLRLLESAAGADGRLSAFEGETDIFITPGYRFRAVDALLTNFHLPRSTLFMLVSAFCGLERMRAAYAHAIRSGYRFYSYGDASLLFRAGAA